MRRTAAAVLAALALTGTAACSTETTPSGGSAGKTTDDCGYAFVHAATIGSSLFEQWAEDGVKRARTDLGVKIDSVESATPPAIADNFRAFAQQKCKKVIASVGFTAAEAMTQVAKEFPDQQFAIIDAEVALPNVRSYTWAVEEATYVAGVAAAKLSRSGTIGAVFGMDIPPLKRWQAGYEEGAKAVNPDVKVLVNYVGSFSDPAKALTLAIAQKQQGADIILPASGSNLGIISDSVKNDFSVVAIDPDEATKAGEAGVLFTMQQKVADSVILLFRESQDTGAEGGTRDLRLRDDVFAFDPFTTTSGRFAGKVPPEVTEAVKQAYDDIVAGRVVVRNPLAGQ
ncbi:BMP family protein [Plantactinospora sp. GCM10030261]|uniref:BMP family lipoprotein n=1 Tax=Plantactinospora sp. GCM10030261 TaxID=3273420 RepID=UPI00361D216F